MVNRLDADLLEPARSDVIAIERLCEHPLDPCSGVVAFLCQQAAEKMVKSVFVANDDSYRMIHGIDNLLMEAESKGYLSETDGIMRQAAFLVSCESIPRYQGGLDIDAALAKEAIASLKEIAGYLESQGYESYAPDVSIEFMRNAEAKSFGAMAF